MRSICAVLSALLFSVCAVGQTFECEPVGAMPNDPSLSCQGIASNNLGVGTGVAAVPSCGFPASGSQYAVLFAAGPLTVPAGGPLARPVSTNATELRIPIPAGASTISMAWEFFNAEGGPQMNYNDGMSVDVVDVNGALVGNLVFVDTHTALAGGVSCGVGGEIAPAGPQTLVATLPAMSGCDYLSIVVWNGADNAFSSRAFIDDVAFNSGLPAACQVPCVPVVGAATLACSSPFGPSSLLVSMSSLPPGGSYFLAVALTAGAYPNGWFYGIDISLQDLGNEINTGFPFSGPVSGSPCSAGQASIGPIFGAPSGVTLYMVALGLQGPGLSGAVAGASNTVAYTIP